MIWNRKTSFIYFYLLYNVHFLILRIHLYSSSYCVINLIMFQDVTYSIFWNTADFRYIIAQIISQKWSSALCKNNKNILENFFYKKEIIYLYIIII